MRQTVRVLAIVTMALSLTAVGLFFWAMTLQLSDTDIRGYLFLPVGALAFLVGFGAFVVGLIAAGMRRQFLWLIGQIAVGVVAVLSPVGATLVSQSVVNQRESLIACQTAIPTAPECQLSPMQIFLQNSPTWVALTALFLVGLVLLLYSFRMRETSVPVAAHHS